MVITTRRLTIRRVAADDWRAVQAIWTDQQRSAYACYDAPNDTSDEAVEARIARWATFADSRDHLFFAVCLAGQMIGYLALNRRPDSHELGYCFHSAWHGQGYARESLAAVLAYAAQRGVAVRFTIRTALDNRPSVRLAEAAGFRLTGTEQVSFYRDEAGRPIVFQGGVYALDMDK